MDELCGIKKLIGAALINAPSKDAVFRPNSDEVKSMDNILIWGIIYNDICNNREICNLIAASDQKKNMLSYFYISKNVYRVIAIATRLQRQHLTSASNKCFFDQSKEFDEFVVKCLQGVVKLDDDGIYATLCALAK